MTKGEFKAGVLYTRGLKQRNRGDEVHENELEKLIVLNNPTEAEVLRGLLEAQEIKVMLSKEAASTVYGLTAGAFSEIEVFVAKSQLAQAKQVLDEYFPHSDREHEED